MVAGPLLRDGVSDKDGVGTMPTSAENWTRAAFANDSVLRLGDAVWLTEIEVQGGGKHRRVEVALYEQRSDAGPELTVWCPKPKAKRVAAVRPEFDFANQILTHVVAGGSDKWKRSTHFELLAPQYWREGGLCSGRDEKCRRPRWKGMVEEHVEDSQGDAQAEARRRLNSFSAGASTVNNARPVDVGGTLASGGELIGAAGAWISGDDGADAECPPRGYYDCSKATVIEEVKRAAPADIVQVFSYGTLAATIATIASCRYCRYN